MMTAQVNRSFDHNTDEIWSNKSLINEKNTAPKSERKVTAVFQSQTQTSSANSIPKLNNTEITESKPPSEVIEISVLAKSILITGIKLPHQVPTKTIQSNADFDHDANLSQKSAFQKNVTSHQFQFQNTAAKPFSQYNRTQGTIPM